MKHFTGYGAYLLFLALRTHFTSAKYDFFQMHGKLRANRESYNKRNDKWFFEKLAKEYNAEELRDFYIANLLNDKHYITDFTDEEAILVYTTYIRQRQSLSYVCSNDMDRIFDHDDPRVPFNTYHDRYPDLVMLFLRRTITLETLVILDDLTGFTSKFDKYYSDDIIWPKISQKISKYRPFLKYDKVKMKHILKGKVNGQEQKTEAVSAEEQAH
jgi:T4 gene Gp59 loader of gp41 DNA helicase/T4 gene Gp59 loader of gp41 DNA helicase C-term